MVERLLRRIRFPGRKPPRRSGITGETMPRSSGRV